MAPRPQTLANRFWGKVDKNGPLPTHRPELGPCWVWTGNRPDKRYGQLWTKRSDGSESNTSAHRISWELHHGPTSSGLYVCHHCDNPACVRPTHLFLGTAADNNRDCQEKGRQARGATHFSRTHPERIARGARHGSRTKPGALPRGDDHPSHQHPENVLRGAEVGTAKLTEAHVREVRILFGSGAWTKKALADRFGVTRTLIYLVVTRKAWRHVED